MRQDIIKRDWPTNSAASGSAIHKLVEEFLFVMERLNHYQFCAPWRHDA